MRQLGLANQMHHDAFKYLPVDINAQNNVRPMLYLQLLPFMEGSTIKDAYDFTVNATNPDEPGIALAGGADASLPERRVVSFMVVARCGDNGGDRKASYGFNYGYGTYANWLMDRNSSRSFLGEPGHPDDVNCDANAKTNITVPTAKITRVNRSTSSGLPTVLPTLICKWKCCRFRRM